MPNNTAHDRQPVTQIKVEVRHGLSADHDVKASGRRQKTNGFFKPFVGPLCILLVGRPSVVKIAKFLADVVRKICEDQVHSRSG